MTQPIGKPATVPQTTVEIMVCPPTETNNRYRTVRTSGMTLGSAARPLVPFVMWDFATEQEARDGANYLWMHTVSERNRIAPYLAEKVAS